jgi:hypothetical protein
MEFPRHTKPKLIKALAIVAISSTCSVFAKTTQGKDTTYEFNYGQTGYYDNSSLGGFYTLYDVSDIGATTKTTIKNLSTNAKLATSQNRTIWGYVELDYDTTRISYQASINAVNSNDANLVLPKGFSAGITGHITDSLDLFIKRAKADGADYIDAIGADYKIGKVKFNFEQTRLSNTNIGQADFLSSEVGDVTLRTISAEAPINDNWICSVGYSSNADKRTSSGKYDSFSTFTIKYKL